MPNQGGVAQVLAHLWPAVDANADIPLQIWPLGWFCGSSEHVVTLRRPVVLTVLIIGPMIETIEESWCCNYD